MCCLRFEKTKTKVGISRDLGYPLFDSLEARLSTSGK
jgi:hypothetical protein